MPHDSGGTALLHRASEAERESIVLSRTDVTDINVIAGSDRIGA